jgi:transcriptional regulator with XRE-family HTH domain
MTATVELWTVIMTDQSTFLRGLGERIASARKTQGLTQVQLGNMVHVTQQVIAEYEAGYRNIPIYRLLSLAESLGVRVEQLLSGAESAPAKRGPAPKIQRQIEQIGRLPKSKQRFVSELLEKVIQEK